MMIQMDLAICGYNANKFINTDSQFLRTVNNLIDLNLNQNPKTPELLDDAKATLEASGF